LKNVSTFIPNIVCQVASIFEFLKTFGGVITLKQSSCTSAMHF
jgi:hypothetical protein